jgi:membrane associated rhomboid family serine protease
MIYEEIASNLLGLVALVLLVPYLDRLRMLRWSEHLAAVVGMHLAFALWLGALAFDGLGGGVVGAYHVLGLAGAALWLGVSRTTWRHGPPEYTQSGPVPLHSEPADHGHHGARP